MNNIDIYGRLTADPTTRETNGSRVASFTVASDTRTKDTDGNYITNFFRVSVWGVLGDNCAKWLHKGNRVIVNGEVVLRSYTDKNGALRYSLDIPRANAVEFVETKSDNSQAAPAAPAQPAPAPAAPVTDTGDDLPF